MRLVTKHYKYHPLLVLTMAHYSLMIFSNFGSGEHKHREREMCPGCGCRYVETEITFNWVLGLNCGCE
jgi:hypothetical protein